MAIDVKTLNEMPHSTVHNANNAVVSATNTSRRN
jgi:hypothetical protein